MRKPVRADTSEADAGALRALRGGDLNRTRIGNDRHEVLDAIVLDG